MPRAKNASIVNFWKNVKKTETCWLWTGCLTKGKYGKHLDNNKSVAIQAYSYKIHFAEISNGAKIIQTCGNTACVNPEHLLEVFRTTKISDKVHDGKICAKHPENNGRRWTHNSACTECHAEKIHDYYENNKEKRLLQGQNWRGQNIEKNKNLIKKWKQHNSAKICLYTANRRADKRRATPAWSIKFFVSEAYDLAARRNDVTNISWHVDHIVPIHSKKVCGLHAHTNLQVIPSAKNISKSNKYWPDMEGELKF